MEVNLWGVWGRLPYSRSSNNVKQQQDGENVSETEGNWKKTFANSFKDQHFMFMDCYGSYNALYKPVSHKDLCLVIVQ